MSTSPSALTTAIYTPQIVTVLNGSNTSSPAQVFGATAVGIVIPQSISGTSLTFQVSIDDVNYYPLTDPDSGADVVAILNGNGPQAVPLNAHRFFPWTSIKIVTSSNQTGDKNFQVGVKAI